MSKTSRLPGFYRHSIQERLRLLLDKGIITREDFDALVTGQNVVVPEEADRLIENVIGIHGLPIGLGLNFVVNEKEYVVPMAVEEPSIVAAVSSAAKTVRAAGGFRCRSLDPLLIGQIQVVGAESTPVVRQTVLEHKERILDLANSLHPNMVARGGGARDIEIQVHPPTSTSPEMFVVHLLVDTRDAMGANLVNSMCEEVAPLIEQLTGGQVFLRILSNLADRAMVSAEAVIPVEYLAGNGYSGDEVRDGIILANQFAEVDAYRAATHNKGIMNGIDAVALATGNDWRAIEAGAHAYAGLHGSYRSLTRWWKTEEGHLAGALELPLKAGTVGGQMGSNPTYGIAHRILGITSARELAELMCAVGLAQNFGALRALSTDGIQRGHMSLHARSVAVAAGTPPALFERVVDRLVRDGDVKVWRANEILAELRADAGDDDHPATAGRGTGFGKIILLGEHAVVYGRHALAAPVDLSMRAIVDEGEGERGIEILIPQWNVSETMELGAAPRNSLEESLQLILRETGLENRPITFHLRSGVPRAMGLGGSAALAVAIIRALDKRFVLGLTDAQVNELAYRAEQHAHGQASGIDNSVATYGRPILFCRGEPPVIRDVKIGCPTPVVVGLSRHEGLTAAMVSRVAQAREKTPRAYERLFDEIDVLTLQGVEELESGNLENLGRCMNLCHGLLNALQVSTHELEELVEIARNHGAIGAKLTGAGGGGAVIALAPEEPERIAQAMRAKRYRAFITHLGDPAEGPSVTAPSARRVSFDDEPLIVVDPDNNVLGHRSKADVHAGAGILHRAFSVFLFNDAGEVLLQQRSGEKPLWPLFWSNACCSHPRRGETEADAAVRRVAEELGVEAEPEYVYTFTYHAAYGDVGSEHEVCSVFLARANGPITANENEIADLRWLTPEALDAALRDEPERYSPWLKLEWAHLRETYAERLAAYGPA